MILFLLFMAFQSRQIKEDADENLVSASDYTVLFSSIYEFIDLPFGKG